MRGIGHFYLALTLMAIFGMFFFAGDAPDFWKDSVVVQIDRSKLPECIEETVGSVLFTGNVILREDSFRSIKSYTARIPRRPDIPDVHFKILTNELLEIYFAVRERPTAAEDEFARRYLRALKSGIEINCPGSGKIYTKNGIGISIDGANLQYSDLNFAAINYICEKENYLACFSTTQQTCALELELIVDQCAKKMNAIHGEVSMDNYEKAMRPLMVCTIANHVKKDELAIPDLRSCVFGGDALH